MPTIRMLSILPSWSYVKLLMFIISSVRHLLTIVSKHNSLWLNGVIVCNQEPTLPLDCEDVWTWPFLSVAAPPFQSQFATPDSVVWTISPTSTYLALYAIRVHDAGN